MQRILHILMVGAAIGGIIASGCTSTPAPTPHASIKAPPSLHESGLRTLGSPSTRPDTIDQTIDVLLERLGEETVVVFREPDGNILQQYPFALEAGPIPQYLRFRTPTKTSHPAYFGELSPGTNASGYLRHAVFVHGWDKANYSARPYQREYPNTIDLEQVIKLASSNGWIDVPQPTPAPDPE